MRILFNDGTTDKVLKWCADNNHYVVNEKVDQSLLRDYIDSNDIDTLVVRIGTTVDRDILESKSLRMVIRAGVGLDNIDLESAKELEVSVYNTPQSAAISVSELTFGLLLSVCRNIHVGLGIGEESFNKAKSIKGYELYGKTLGIIGYGRIGKRVGDMARVFGMKVIKYDKFNDVYDTKDDVLTKSDIITLHCPFNEVVIGKEEFKRMKMNSIIINAGRGGLIDEEALISNILSGRVLGAGLDTFINEPKINPSLLLDNRVVCTPHIGSQTYGCQERIGQEVIEIIESF